MFRRSFGLLFQRSLWFVVPMEFKLIVRRSVGSLFRTSFCSLFYSSLWLVVPLDLRYHSLVVNKILFINFVDDPIC